MSILVLDDVKVHYGGVKAVDGVSFGVEPGQLCGVMGPNGAGKTTIINAITGTTRLSSGSIAFRDKPLTSAKPYEMRRMGLMRTFQGIRLVPELSVRDNVRVAAEQRGSRRGWGARATEKLPVDQVVDKTLERLGLDVVRDQKPTALPYGTQRRVEIARALSTQPDLILLDEPVAGMNQTERAEIAAILRELRADGLAMLVIEHDLKMLLDLSDHLVVLNFGKLLAKGEPHATARLPEVQRAYLGDGHGNA